ncbi:uncharacterized protein LOC107320921 isoform X2 [Coturnix japonica]|uniref:uncharacterized protein LOC107320921 isoform X2 n=1 Tax=Coturnix japonica TaxID=93934 RepID=UPI00077784D8|nr:uncharacterized protein LOC107320921 isoform X2 [Coturnix japonica]
MEEVWVVYLCLILFVIVVFLMKRNPHVEEVKKELESKSPPPSSSFFPSNVGKQLEHTQEELEHYLERLTHVFFETDARKREGHHDQKSHHHQHKSDDATSEAVEHSGKEAAYSPHLASHTRVQERTTPPGSTENIVEEIGVKQPASLRPTALRAVAAPVSMACGGSLQNLAALQPSWRRPGVNQGVWWGREGSGHLYGIPG